MKNQDRQGPGWLAGIGIYLVSTGILFVIFMLYDLSDRDVSYNVVVNSFKKASLSPIIAIAGIGIFPLGFVFVMKLFHNMVIAIINFLGCETKYTESVSICSVVTIEPEDLSILRTTLRFFGIVIFTIFCIGIFTLCTVYAFDEDKTFIDGFLFLFYAFTGVMLLHGAIYFYFLTFCKNAKGDYFTKGWPTIIRVVLFFIGCVFLVSPYAIIPPDVLYEILLL